MPFDEPGIRDIWAQRERGARYITFGEDLAIAERFTAAITPRDPDMPICRLRVAIEDGRPVCTELRCERRPGGRPLSGRVLRDIPLTTYVHDVVANFAFRFTRSAEQGDGPELELDGKPAWRLDIALRPEPSPTSADRESARTMLRARLRQPRRGIPISDDDLREIAALYRAAVLEGRPPTKTVSDAMHVSRPTASRWIARARERKMLGAALTGRAGEREED